MTVKEALEWGRRLLQTTGRSAREAGRDVQVLLGHVLGVERSALYAHPERELTEAELLRLTALLERRQRGEPVAYLLGHKEFFGLDLLVDRRVLIPRPETELLVEAVLAEARNRLSRGEVPIVADIGTGSGAIAVALAVNEPHLPYLYACDSSAAALEVARLNCQRHGVSQRVRLLQGDLAAPLPEPVDLLVANLPYVGTEERELLAPDVRDFEPAEALFAGPRGLTLLERLLRQLHERPVLKDRAKVFLEIGYQQREALEALARQLWPTLQLTCQRDYAGQERLLILAF
ncbi:MAG: peptide chain release factor N(5)-glutamine methyltransferase [Thermogemmatispora sp.]|uniref:Release factor glutamine methyltransferase n=1 Tax=Thermogemmatispora aurantia TaxID=2045279 RepID=A0A5J4K9A6_9CHLR|nr:MULTISPECIES: peptide chain release factor N(5)-glutamine methyltransferase [Thermogemmatispora]MBE3566805.1 peptide chain release factor N(5)-glutamine methyltransferase [Thermogemmatispora sp.]GER83319.1 release factor glutamine methyltransferase [Thermogemmatispora aurantia]